MATTGQTGPRVGAYTRRRMLQLGVGTVALPLLSACGGGATASSSMQAATTAAGTTGSAATAAATTGSAATVASSSAAAGKPAALQFWYAWSVSDAPMKYYQNLANTSWAAKHPGSSLKIVSVPDSQQEAKFTAAFAAGQGPDLFTDMVDIYTQRGISTPLPADLAKTLQDNLIPASVLNYEYNNQFRAVPFIPIGSLGVVKKQLTQE
ncbi:MAG TPA: extracellular solute-binding protein [Chloroflexota bacterium]